MGDIDKLQNANCTVTHLPLCTGSAGWGGRGAGGQGGRWRRGRGGVLGVLLYLRLHLGTVNLHVLL